MPKEIRVNAVIDPALKKRLYRVLLEEDLTFSDWLRKQIEEYVGKKEPKERRVKEMADRRKEKRWIDTTKNKGKKTKKAKGEK